LAPEIARGVNSGSRFPQHDRYAESASFAIKAIGRSKLAYANFEPATDPPRGFNATGHRVAVLPRRQEPYRNFRGALNRLQEGGEYCSGGEAEAAASPALIEFAGERKRRPRRDIAQARMPIFAP
jgi:hypothetical protein